jgi:hypothetical protein
LGSFGAVTLTRDQELWACAIAVEREHGKAAFLRACFEVDRLDAEGEHEAAGVWRAVLLRIEMLEQGASTQ